MLNLVDRVLEVYQSPIAPLGPRTAGYYARCDILDAAARVTSLAACGSSIAVAALVP